MAVGYVGGWSPPNQQDWLNQILAASSQAPNPAMDNSAAGLTQRYGNAPETFGQLATINGWNQPTPRDGNPITPSGPPMANPIPTPAPATPTPAGPGGGGGGDYNSLLQELLANARGTGYIDQINGAYDQQSKLAAEAAGLSWTDDMASRGMLPRDNQSRDLRARLVGQAMSPIAANRAAALADAANQRQTQLGNIAGMMSEQQAREESRRRQEAQDAEARRQFDATMSYNQSQLDYRRNQDNQARQDEQNRQAQLQAAMTGGGGPQPAPGPQGPSGGGGGGGGQASPSFFDLIAGQPGYTINGQGAGGGGDAGGGGGGGGYAGGGAGGGGTNFLPTLDGGSNAGLWSDGRGGTTWHNPNNQRPQTSATSFSGVSGGGGATSFARPPGASPTPSAAAAPVPGGGQVMGGSQQVGFGGGPANSPSFNTPAGFAGYGQSWNTPQIAGQAAGVRTGRRDDIFNAATGRYA